MNNSILSNAKLGDRSAGIFTLIIFVTLFTDAIAEVLARLF